MKAYSLGPVTPRFVTVSAATNANPIVLTVAAGLLAGAKAINANLDVLTIGGVTGNTAANASFPPGSYTVLTPTTVSINIAGNGAYVSGGLASAPQQLTTAPNFPTIPGVSDVSKLLCCKLLITPSPAGTAPIFLGLSGMNQGTLAGVVRPINPPPATGIFDYYEVDIDGTNVIPLADYYVDAQKPGTEAGIVTFFLR